MAEEAPISMADVDIDVVVSCPTWEAIPEAVRLCYDAASATLRHLSVAGRPIELSLLLADDGTVRDLNRRYRRQDKATNVLSFPGYENGLAAYRGAPDGLPLLLGDVVLASGVIMSEAEVQGKSAADHLRHLVAHGVLHLLGFDHESDDEAERMEAVERAILASLGIADPYANDAAAANI